MSLGHAGVLWALLFLGGAALEAYGLITHDPTTLSELTRWIFHIDRGSHTVRVWGARAFVGSWILLSCVYIPHIVIKGFLQ